MKLRNKLAVLGGVAAGLAANASNAFAQGGVGIDLGGAMATTDGFATEPQAVVNTVVSVVFVVGALLALAYLIMGGIQWITAAGDKSKTESARNHITAALIGLLILAGAFAIFQVIMSVVGVDGGDVFEIIQTMS